MKAKKPERKIATSFRLSRKSYFLLRALGAKNGALRTAVVEAAIRELAQKHGLIE